MFVCEIYISLYLALVALLPKTPDEVAKKKEILIRHTKALKELPTCSGSRRWAV